MRPYNHSFLLSVGLLIPLAAAFGACSAAGDNHTFDGTDDKQPPVTDPEEPDLNNNPDLGDGSVPNPGADPKTCKEAEALKSYIGCDFWPTVTANNVWSTFDFAVVVANAGDAPAKVTVTRGSTSVASAEIAPNSLAKIYLPWVPQLKGPDADVCGSAVPLAGSVRVDDGAYHLVSDVPVTTYQFNALEYKGEGGPSGKDWSSCPGDQFCFTSFSAIGCFSFSNDASLLLPSTAMTGNYRVTGQKGWVRARIGPTLTVTGTQDNTSVTIKLSASAQVLAGGGVAAAQAGGTVTFTVGAGDVVEVVGDPGKDLSGSLVTASHPVQVLAGMPCVQVPDDTSACDHVEESVFPAETLGKHYFVSVPTSPNGKIIGHVVRIYGNVDGTQLTYPSGQPDGAPTTIGAGQVVDLNIVSKNFEIVGDHEFAVSSFMLGAARVDPGQIAGNEKGDPSQSLATAVEQYRKKYIFLAPSDYDENYVDIVQPMDAKVTLDGADVAVAPTTIGSGFGIARVPLNASGGGAHVLTATAPVGIQVMGYGSYTSYHYPGGLNLATIAPPPPR